LHHEWETKLHLKAQWSYTTTKLFHILECKGKSPVYGPITSYNEFSLSHYMTFIPVTDQDDTSFQNSGHCMGNCHHHQTNDEAGRK